MRIVKGRWCGKQFRLPSLSKQTRPTSNYAKEGLLNILEHNYTIREKRVLDLFAGIGNMGFEFLSLDAKHVTMVEKSATQCDFIKKVATDLNVPHEQMKVFRMDVFRYLQTPDQERFDFIFADPPFAHWYQDEIAEKIVQHNLLCAEGLFIYEAPKTKQTFPSKYIPIRTSTYGDIQFHFFDLPSLTA